MKQRVSKIYTAALVILLMVAVISISVACPILIRPFYYAHIDGLDLPETTGFSRETIKEAYDQVLDYCVYGKEFGTGSLRWSEEGKNHFQDCQGLFRLDFILAAASLLGLAICRGMRNFAGVRAYRPGGRGPSLWAGEILLILFGVIGGLGAINFDKFFVIFHKVFFPGKGNWIFDPAKDQIILVMPQEFFRNCAILIVGLIILACIIMMLVGRRRRSEPFDATVGPGFKLY